MWPWAHVASAYLLLAGVRWVRGRRHPTDIGAIAVGVGALLPDLIDKPLAWRLDVLPYGRTLAHSLFFAAVLFTVVWYVGRVYEYERAFAAFGIGYLAHLAGDAFLPAWNGNWEYLLFLGWPVTAPPYAGEVIGLINHLQRIEPTPFILLQVGITIAGIALWWSHSRPGLSTVTQLVWKPAES